MKLIGSLSSPYVRKVRIVMAEKKLDYQFVEENVWAADTRIMQYNPLGKVPCLIMEDGGAMFDSRVIVEYLDSASPVTKLLPEDTRPRIQMRRWEALADGCLDAVVAIIMERRRPQALQYDHWLGRQREKIDRALRAMSDDLGSRAFCCGDFFNLADVAVGCCLGFLDLRLPEIDWRSPYSNLAKLSEKLANRPSFKDTVPPKA